MIPDWDQIDTVLLDMDGTLLDLSFDMYFWGQLIPETYAKKHGISFDDAYRHLEPIFMGEQGNLAWYCLDYWTKALDMPVAEMKRAVKDRIGERPGTQAFLAWLKAQGKTIVMATNAHRETLAIKLAEVDIEHYFDALVSSHDFGHPKEDQEFWDAIIHQQGFDKARTLFVDDSFSVLASAERFGIGHLLCITQPSSQHPAREVSQWPAVNYLDEALPHE
ncbi:GMP/IMP nucleotidase [uncultured Umboniibacter sp.]|uniref:GMP/IMP nucleotidase n=1 Tax=uncultured Umboniibacter sp. TaxID=1798917 RepID=UPI00261C3633|nr:GMP/IMP nucleotidase [uncultured Umboniibacter sp.]